MIKYINFIILTIITTACFAQVDSIKLVKYSSGFRFNEGLYVRHSQLLHNDPVPKTRIISKYNKSDFDFFDKLLDDNVIVYYDEYGLRKEVEVNDLWGFCRRGSIYINWGDDFNRIPVVGSLCHFIASVTTYEDRYYNPSYGYSYYNTPTTQSKTEIYQFMLDFKTGKVIEYSVNNIKVILMADPELFDEYNELKKKKQKQMKFLYLRKFNEKHPLYVPVN